MRADQGLERAAPEGWALSASISNRLNPAVHVKSVAIMSSNNCTFFSLEVTCKGGTRAEAELVGTLTGREKQQTELEQC